MRDLSGGTVCQSHAVGRHRLDTQRRARYEVWCEEREEAGEGEEYATKPWPSSYQGNTEREQTHDVSGGREGAPDARRSGPMTGASLVGRQIIAYPLTYISNRTSGDVLLSQQT